MADNRAAGVTTASLGDSRHAKMQWIAAAVWAAGLCLLFHDTLGPMLHTWLTSETFTHGIVVAPISIWLMWRLRESLNPALCAGPSPAVTALVLIFAASWVAGELVSVQLVTQLAFVGMLVAGIIAVLGLRAAKVAMFPLAFLFLMVPIGSGLEPPMMDLTAKYTVKLIQLTGIPVYQEGRFFELPSGSWSVVEACSGVRYLIASFTLGLIYAHLNYRSMLRKLAFVAASIVVPIIANIVRAYLIVMLGHLSGMQLATGVDHLIYGWIFFGVVMLLLFLIGGLWVDRPAVQERETIGVTPTGLSFSRVLLSLALAGIFAAAGPTVYQFLTLATNSTKFAAFDLAPTANWTCQSPSLLAWQPRDVEADRRISLTCAGQGEVYIFADQYLTQEQGREVARHNIDLKGEDGNRWRTMRTESRKETVGPDESLRVIESVLRSNLTGEYVLVWFWYLVNDDPASSPVLVKILELKHAVRRDYRLSSRVYMAVPLELGKEREARSTMRSFLAEGGGGLVNSLTSTQQ